MRAVDCVIVGGSYSALSAALALGRSLRQTLVIDEGLPCNRYTPHSQNFLTQDGRAPSEIASIGKQQIQDKYKTVEFLQGRVTSVTKTDAIDASPTSFEVTTGSGDVFASKTILFASGIKDIFPDIEGFAECWGKSVIHCPYCHGYEFQSKATGILLKDTNFTMHMASVVRNLTPNLKVFSDGKDPAEIFSDEERGRLEKNGIEILSSPVKEFQHEKDGYFSNIVFADGSSVPLTAMYAHLPFELNAKHIMEELGCEINDDGYLVVDGMQKTNVPGVFGCGDATTRFRAVANAVYGGNIAGAVINMQLCGADFAGRE